MKKTCFLVFFCLVLLNCKSQENKYIKVTVKSTNNNEKSYYFKNEKIIAMTLSKDDSIFFKYQEDLLIKIEQYKFHKLTGEANYFYENKIRTDYTYSENYDNYYEKLESNIPYVNKYEMLNKDFYYIDAVWDRENYISNTKLKSTQDLQINLDVDVGLLNARFSPFIFGTTIKIIKLHIVDNFLKEMDADFIDNPSGQSIKYKKYYEYDKHGRLIFTKTLNVSSGEIEGLEKVKYEEKCCL